MKLALKEQKRAARRSKILDAAQKLIYTKGYEQMTIQDLLDELQISKGAFYYYFSSKQSVLEALIDRSMAEVESLLIPIIEDSELHTIEKFEIFFKTSANWKITQKDFMLGVLHAWYADENALFRQKSQTRLMKQIAPLLNSIIQQGIQEGVFSSPYPDQLNELVLTILFGMSDNMAHHFLDTDKQPVSLKNLENSVLVYTHAVERVLGAPHGSLHFVDSASLGEWISST